MSKPTPQEVVRVAVDLRKNRKVNQMKDMPDEWVRYVEVIGDKLIFTVPNSEYQIIWKDCDGLMKYQVYDDYGTLIVLTESFTSALSYTDFNPTDLLASEVKI